MGKAQLDVVNSLIEGLSCVAILRSMITTVLVTREKNARILIWVGPSAAGGNNCRVKQRQFLHLARTILGSYSS